MTIAKLENQSVYILREAFNKLHDLAMLWSIGKDSTVLLWLARKAFLGRVPFPLVHVDTSYKIPQMIAYRDRLVREWGLELRVARNEEALAGGQVYPTGRATRVACCGSLKKDALRQALDRWRFTGVIVGVRRDEEPTRAKERYFSPRDKNMEWNVADQPPELWTSSRRISSPAHTSVSIRCCTDGAERLEYIQQENIPVTPCTSPTTGASATAASAAGRAPFHQVHRSHRVRDRRGIAGDPDSGTCRPCPGPGKRRCLRETPQRWIHVSCPRDRRRRERDWRRGWHSGRRSDNARR